jgi:hypothetical protein
MSAVKTVPVYGPQELPQREAAGFGRPVAQNLVDVAHETCPYSHTWRRRAAIKVVCTSAMMGPVEAFCTVARALSNCFERFSNKEWSNAYE